MFHIELRQFPHVARVFNLTREELEDTILAAWVAGQAVECQDRRWAPERARLEIYEGARLRPDEIGMGRGWANATRGGTEVTARVIEEAQDALRARDQPGREGVHELKQKITARCADGRLAVDHVARLAGERHPSWRVSDRLAVAEQSVWELLHEGQVRLLAGLDAQRPEAIEVLAKPGWAEALLAWETWAPSGPARVLLEAEPAGEPAEEPEA
ncbi:MAG: hypothetical protein ACR2OB_13450 [Solirubrobacteraceae bacterium]